MNGRVCTQCQIFKTAENFASRNGRKNPLVSRCHECRKANYNENPARSRERAREYYWANREQIAGKARAKRELSIGRLLWEGARRRAKRRGIPFDIEVVDIVVPAECPVLGIPLAMSVGAVAQNSPTLDRVIPCLGYVKGNVLVISHRANTIKQDATPEELLRVAEFFRVAITAVEQQRRGA